MSTGRTGTVWTKILEVKICSTKVQSHLFVWIGKNNKDQKYLCILGASHSSLDLASITEATSVRHDQQQLRSVSKHGVATMKLVPRFYHVCCHWLQQLHQQQHPMLTQRSYKQEAQLSQRGRAMLCVTEYFAKFYSNYGPVLYELRDKARHWSKINFSHPLHLTPQSRGFLHKYCHKVW